MLETALAPIQIPPQTNADTADTGVGNELWIEALPARIYTTPQYGEVPVSVDKLERMIRNFNSRIRGQDVATDFEHGADQSKGLQASGWYKEFEIRPSSDDPAQQSLWAKVAFTDDAKKEIGEGKWKYWSLEWDDEYTVNDTGELVPDVIIGGGLTNRPVAKRTMPINFSEELWNELDEDTQKAFAVWTTKYVNSLPDSAFLYVEPGSATDKSKRHLPYKDASGKIDLPHLRNAIARIPQMKGISSSMMASLQAKARKLLGGSQKAASEQSGTAIRDAYDLLVQDGFEVTLSEHAVERSEPGTGPSPIYSQPEDPQPDPGTGQYVPRVSTDPTENPAIGGGWRRDPLPLKLTDPGAPQPNQKVGLSEIKSNKGGGNNLPTFEEEIAAILGMVLNGETEEEFGNKLKGRITTVFSEHKALKDAVSVTGEEKQFAEQFPHVWREHQSMLERDRKTRAHAFSESVKTVHRAEGERMLHTNGGLSALALDKIQEVHMKFSEGNATIADYEEVIQAIMNGGIVQYGENGSSLTAEVHEIDTRNIAGLSSARRLFAEKVTEIQKSHADEMAAGTYTYAQAVTEAAEKYPDIAAAYRMASPA
jgi:hypothetical protein